MHVKGGWAEGDVHRHAGGRRACAGRQFLDGRPFRALVRFSNGGGNPDAHDGDRGGRGIGGEAVSRRRRTHRPARHLGTRASRRARPKTSSSTCKLARRDPDDRPARHGGDRRVPRGASRRPAAALGRGRRDAAARELARGHLQRHPRVPLVGGRRTPRTGCAPGGCPSGGDETLTDDEAQQRDRDYLAADLREPARRRVRRRSRCWPGSPVPAIRSTIRPPRGPRIARRSRSGIWWSNARSSRPRRRVTFGCSIRCGCATVSSRPPIRSCASGPKVYDVSARGRWSGE